MDWDQAFSEISELNLRVKSLAGLNLFESPHFIEGLICNLCGFTKPQYKNDAWDGESIDGARVEIKHSNATSCLSHSNSRYFRWEKLNGTTGKGKSATIYILTGYDANFADQRCLTVFVIPAWVVGEKFSLEVQISANHKLKAYQVEFSEIKDAVGWYAKMGKIQGIFRCLTNKP